MRNYEIIFMIHPDSSEKVSNIIQFYSNLILKKKGKIHRLEDWGRRQLAYCIKKIHKAHYVLMNIEVFPKMVDILRNHLKFNVSILRSIIISVKNIITETSPMIKIKDDKKIIKKNVKII